MNRLITDYIVRCHTDSDADIGLKEIDGLDRKHGWFRCIHHFVIRRDGEIETGPRDYKAPCMGLNHFNQRSVSVCMVGKDSFTSQQEAAFDLLVRELTDEYPDIRVVTPDELFSSNNKGTTECS